MTHLGTFHREQIHSDNLCRCHRAHILNTTALNYPVWHLHFIWNIVILTPRRSCIGWLQQKDWASGTKWFPQCCVMLTSISQVLWREHCLFLVIKPFSLVPPRSRCSLFTLCLYLCHPFRLKWFARWQRMQWFTKFQSAALLHSFDHKLLHSLKTAHY